VGGAVVVVLLVTLHIVGVTEAVKAVRSGSR
jgi:hypothetical protein